MQDLFVVHVFDRKTDLGEHVKNFIFWEVVKFPILFPSHFVLGLDLRLQIAAIAVVHHNAQLSLFGFVDFSESRDVRVV